MVSEIFEAARWRPVPGFTFTDITYHRAVDSGTVRVAFDRPEVRNAFRPHTVDELYRALDHARMSSDVGVVLLTGNGPSPKDGGWAFCAGGDQRIRGRSGYQYDSGETADTVDVARAGRLHILEVQRLIRFMPKGDRRRCRQFRCQLRQRIFGPPGGPEVRPRDLFPGPGLHRRADTSHGRGQRGHRPRRAGDRGRAVSGRDQREIASGATDAEVWVQPARR